MKRGLCLTTCVLAMVLTACDLELGPSTFRYEGAGITFITLMESSRAETGPGGVIYQSDTVKAHSDGRQLWVNDQAYGEVKAGDLVDLSTPGQVLVNGSPRAPSVHTDRSPT